MEVTSGVDFSAILGFIFAIKNFDIFEVCTICSVSDLLDKSDTFLRLTSKFFFYFFFIKRALPSLLDIAIF